VATVHVEQGNPPFSGRIPAVRPADVGAYVNQVGLGGVNGDPGDVPAAPDGNRTPAVLFALRRSFRRHLRSSQRRAQKQAYGDRSGAKLHGSHWSATPLTGRAARRPGDPSV